MRGSPTDQFLARALRQTASVLKQERRPVAAKWCRIAADRLELKSAELRNERAKAESLDVLTAEKPCSHYYALFKHMADNHNLTLLDSELDEIVRCVHALKEGK